MKTIVFIDETAKLGGAEINLIRILPRLKQDGWNPILLVPETGPLVDKLAAYGIPCQVVPSGRFYSISSYVGDYQKIPNPFACTATLINGCRWAFALERVLRQIQPEIVQTVSMLSHLFGGWAARKVGFPVVAHVQDIVAASSAFGMYRGVFQAWARKIPTCIVCISPLVNHQFHTNATAAQKTRLIWNMVDVDSFKPDDITPSASERLRIGTVARLTPWKGHHIALDAAHLLMARDKDFHWQFAGDASMGEGAYASKLFRQVEQCKLKQNVDFLGWQEDPAQFYRSLNLLVHLPTEPEPFGLVIAEALSSGIPVITTHGGLDRIVEEAGGIVVPASDPRMAMSAILNMADHIENHREDLKSRARSIAMKYFSPHQIMPQWLQLYEWIAT